MLYMILALTGLSSQISIASSVKERYSMLLKVEELLMEQVQEEITEAHH